MPFLWGPAISPDGREVAFSQGEADGSWHIWSVPFEGGPARQLASTDAGEVYPRWSPDGTYILFNTWTEPRRLGRVTSRGGGSAPTMLSFTGEGTAAFADIAPDGRRIALSRAEPSGERIYVGPAEGGAAQRLTASSGAIPRWSPDGSLIAFGGTRSFSGGIFTIRADGSGERRLTSEGGWPVGGPTDDRSAISPSADAAISKSAWSASMAGSRGRSAGSTCSGRIIPSALPATDGRLWSPTPSISRTKSGCSSRESSGGWTAFGGGCRASGTGCSRDASSWYDPGVRLEDSPPLCPSVEASFHRSVSPKRHQSAPSLSTRSRSSDLAASHQR